MKSAEDWVDDGFDWGIEDPRPFREAQIQRYRQIQADALKYCVGVYDDMQRDGFTLGVEMIRKFANQLDPQTK